MSATPPRPDPTSPVAISSATFATGFRGYDQAEVRAFLTHVADQFGALQGENASLRAELDVLRSGRPELDEESVAALLGEETARVLTTAREAAAQLRAKAEDGAARMVREAEEEAARLRAEVADEVHRTRHQADTELVALRSEAAEAVAAAQAEASAVRAAAEEEAARVRAEAQAEVEQVRSGAVADAERVRAEAQDDAANEIELAKQEGREMVAEARAVRERMLADLSRRRDAARVQLEQLRLRRDALLVALSDVRARLDEATADAAAADELFTAELPPMPAGLEAGLLVPAGLEGGPLVEGDVPELEAVRALAGDDDAGAAAASLDHEGMEPDSRGGAHAAGASRSEAGERAAHETAVGAARGIAIGEFGEPELPPADEVDDLFARLRSAGAGTVAARAAEAAAQSAETAQRVDTPATATTSGADDVPDDDGADGEEAPLDPFAAREAALAPIRSVLGRHLKRALADEQNEVLDHLRRAVPGTIAELVGGEDAQTHRYAAALVADARDAAAAGARSAGATTKGSPPDDLELLVTVAIHDAVTLPLRARLEAALGRAGGDQVEAASLLRAAYREWRMQHVDEAVSHITLVAHGAGVVAAAPEGAELVWVVDESTVPCADCHDDVLAGAVAAGEEFPTGHKHPPAHVGCCCLLVNSSG